MSMRGNPVETLRTIGPAILVAAVTWWAGGHFTEPHRKHEKREQEAIARLRGQIDGAAAAGAETRGLEAATEAFRAQIDRPEQKIPGPLAPVSIPDDLKKHFARSGLSVTVKLVKTDGELAGLPGYARGFWSVTLPLAKTSQQTTGALLATAQFEQQQPFVKVLDLAIQPDPAEPARRLAELYLTAFFRK